MGRLIHLREIDQFSGVMRIPASAVSDAILEGVRCLHEINELEPALQQILFDPNDTHHGPTEIADIITSRVILRGERRVGAFILKGKSFSKVTGKDVTHQIAKARTIPDVGVLALVAVGDIQDDAHRDFVQIATDADLDYLIVDRVDLSRLLLAYEKICPLDGTIFSEAGECRHGHHRTAGATLELPIRGEIYSEVVALEDTSTGLAKRYSAEVVIDRHASREAMRAVLRDRLQEIKSTVHHGNDFARARWGDQPAQVVWIFLAGTHEDLRTRNWLARAEWIDPELDPDSKPPPMKGDEEHEGLQIIWNPQHAGLATFYRKHTTPKGPWLKRARELIDRSVDLADQAASALKILDSGQASPSECERALMEIIPAVNELEQDSGSLPFAPEDLKELDLGTQLLWGSLGNVTLPFSEVGRPKWPLDERIRMARRALNAFTQDLETVSAQLRRVR